MEKVIKAHFRTMKKTLVDVSEEMETVNIPLITIRTVFDMGIIKPTKEHTETNKKVFRIVNALIEKLYIQLVKKEKKGIVKLKYIIFYIDKITMKLKI